MERMLERSFRVEAEPGQAWATLVDAARWPSWARHLRSVELSPPGVVGPTSTATLTLTNRTKARVSVSGFDDGQRFRWDGSFLWLRIGYDHIVEPADEKGSRITFTVDGDGVGRSTIGRLFTAIYARNLDRAIPRLQEQLAA